MIMQERILAQKADIILTNGKDFTSDTNLLHVQALAIKGNKIIAAGTDEEIKKLAFPNGFAIGTHFFTIFPGFSKNLFVGYSPCYTGYGHCKYKQIKYLQFDKWVHI